MNQKNVDIVFAIDTSESMRPCINGLSKNLEKIIVPFQSYGFNVRFGLLGYSVGKSSSGGFVAQVNTLSGGLESIYKPSNQGDSLFTNNPKLFSDKIKSLEQVLQGDENHLFALDMAFDFPFGPVSTTRRVVCLFSDERIEDGFLGEWDPKIIVSMLCKKAMARRIMLYMALPESSLLDDLSAIPSSHIESINGGDGLASIDFSKLLIQMGKSISVTSLQGNEGCFEIGVHGQKDWGFVSQATFREFKK
ncbi:MAG: vWA domain-containing protein [Chryseobacterium sp.]